MGKPKKSAAAPPEKPLLHTPGPWTVEYDPDDADGHVIRMATNIKSPGHYDSHHRVEYDHGLLPGEKSESARAQFAQAEANAHLMGAGPELLAALLACERIFMQGTKKTTDAEWNRAADLVFDAVAKATKYEPVTEWDFDDDLDDEGGDDD